MASNHIRSSLPPAHQSTIVALVAVAVAATATALQCRIDALRDVGGIVGSSISGTFLLVLRPANLLVSDKLGLYSGIWWAVGRLNAQLTNFGIAVIGISVAS